ncbi:BT_3928 family protein [Apibacter adventoris]|uniref:DoxX family protein n=1 Tax=Apibacter adventoris TaxID=1679466 RepID=A0A2S8AAN4_9FLAO|nr:BT_3928 family protein [Apibacter adventoris]PQL91658.1 DoxX family protein [Apibacter adventoris]
MKYVTNFFRVIVGIIFIISGIVKTIDPIGFSYKLEEYFGEGVFNISFLENLALPLSIFFVIAEVMLGVLLLLGICKKFTVYALLSLIIFFSFLTFYSAYFNKVTDCGCFGDALKLKPWFSFYKDIILLLFIIILVLGLKYIKPVFPSKIRITLVIISFVFCCWIAYMGIAHLPLIDFRPYAIGKDLKKEMNDGIPPEISIIYTMENSKDKKQKKVSSEEYMNSGIWEDTLWHIIKTDQKIIKEAVLPSVHDFYIECDGFDRAKEVVNSDKFLVFTIPYAHKLSIIEKAKLRKITNELMQKNINFVVATNDPKIMIPIKSCITDPTTLKTINRSVIGLMILKKGIVVAKYHVNDLPTIKQIEKL